MIQQTQEYIKLNKEVVRLIKVVDKAMTLMLKNSNDITALEVYNGKFEELEKLLMKLITMGINPHTPAIDLLNKDERNVFERAYKNAERILLITNFN